MFSPRKPDAAVSAPCLSAQSTHTHTHIEHTQSTHTEHTHRVHTHTEHTGPGGHYAAFKKGDTALISISPH